MKNTNKCSVSIKEDDLLLQHEISMAESINESKERYRKIVQAGIAQWVKDFKDGLIKVSTVDDLKKLIELDIDLQKDD
ncbi:hypothetical protein FCT18_20995 [Lysinibacillus sphaericus]|uniref:Uncharacterized protein n=1 Tax=Lysinibacillus sphaericus TaxID=1421 RepID=A0A2S0JZZ8_LYSSH|nr:hypothetical protein [Lysinibacillus sphaericus]AVK96712.1 hypothetical protein LS41612_10755 [Lysinibacillus sphaericus]MED4543064.1 hypothetical protein [Lysinibacillus sphaericus]TKI16395.1 hypothetical protein FCT18_20995 [Lysinibacillus sphaericus]SUV17473.1 Uncharacterised protein [Lysinibacillus sphaericus]GEC83966.1 hypothetical protein LSP03_37090 [Lysinibacillus sphaericus]